MKEEYFSELSGKNLQR